MKTENERSGLRLNLPANPLEALTGRKPQTTFWQDFSIADFYGLQAVEDTYKRAFAEWKTNTEYITEFCVVLNHKIWYFYEYQQKALKRATEAKAAAEAATDKEAKAAAETEVEKQNRIAEAARAFGILYDKLWKEADEWCMNNLTGKDVEYYINFTD